MNKAMLASVIAEKLGISTKDATTYVDAVFATISEAIAVGTKVTIAGFGSFESVERAARTARNPHTGEQVDVPAKNAPSFKAAQALKDAVNS